MPVKFFNGTRTEFLTGLDPESVRAYAGVRTEPFVAAPLGALPKSPLLAAYASRKAETDPVTGKVRGNFATGIRPELYRPGGLLWQGTGN